MRSAALLALVLTLTGCSGALAALRGVSEGAQWVGTLVDVAESGSDAYFRRHPSLEREARVDAAVRRARASLAALERLLALGDAAAREDVTAARSEALAAYGELRSLLAELGVLTATPPAGGAETSAPEPEPLALPSAAQVEADWRGL